MIQRLPPRPMVYVAGPYSTGDPVVNTHKAIKVAGKIHRMEGVPFVPHLSLLWHLVTPQPYNFWMDMDYHILERCDALYRISGESPGADNEVEYSDDHCGIPVFREGRDGDIELYQWITDWIEQNDPAAGHPDFLRRRSLRFTNLGILA